MSSKSLEATSAVVVECEQKKLAGGSSVTARLLWAVPGSARRDKAWRHAMCQCANAST